MTQESGVRTRKKIAILGGGAGSIAAAFGLTSRPGWQDDYEITVYQLGWRLGGKGASGRNLDVGSRIEEHGIHLWFGFYQNAFRMMRQTYSELAARELAPGSPFQSWRDAFIPQHAGGFLEQEPDGWRQLVADFPPLPGEPGEESLFEDQTQPATPWLMLCHLLDAMVSRYESDMPPPEREAHKATLPVWLSAFLNFAEAVESWTALHFARALARRLHPDPAQHSSLERKGLLHLLERFAESLFVHRLSAFSSKIRLLELGLDFCLTAAMGILRDGVLERGFYAIDDRDLSEWLRSHGARYPDSALVLSVYDAVFAYENGEPERRRLSAGCALYGMLLMTFTYRGSISWRMCAGMGDVVFAPAYLVLRDRGVRFEFFRRVEALELSPGDSGIAAIRMEVQAEVTGDEYQPLITVKGLPCWPSTPLFDQLKNGNELRNWAGDFESNWSAHRGPVTRLTAGIDFDQVVLGISLAGVRQITGELSEASVRWRDMVDKVGTVQTQAFQIWMNRTSQDLGATNVSGSATVLTSFVEPFDTYADLAHLLPREDWPAGNRARQIAYFCSALSEPSPIPPPGPLPEFPANEKRRVVENARTFLEQHASDVWPVLKSENRGMDWSLLDCSDAPPPADTFAAQYFRANIDPSERYVLSLPGTAVYRLAPGDSGFENLYLAGDWTLTGLNWGCVEAAVISGLMAAQALCGYPEFIFGAPPLPKHALSRSADSPLSS